MIKVLSTLAGEGIQPIIADKADYAHFIGPSKATKQKKIIKEIMAYAQEIITAFANRTNARKKKTKKKLQP